MLAFEVCIDDVDRPSLDEPASLGKFDLAQNHYGLATGCTFATTPSKASPGTSLASSRNSTHWWPGLFSRP